MFSPKKTFIDENAGVFDECKTEQLVWFVLKANIMLDLKNKECLHFGVCTVDMCDCVLLCVCVNSFLVQQEND